MSGPDDPRPIRWRYALLGYLFVGLAFVGVVVPGLPTFPFLLLAAWAASRGSQRLHDWLYDHPRFGPSLVQWRDQRAIGRGSKAAAVGLFLVSWLILLWRGSDWRLLVPLALFFIGMSIFLLSRPEPMTATRGRSHDRETPEDRGRAGRGPDREPDPPSRPTR